MRTGATGATAQRIQGFAFTRSNVDVEVGAPVGSRVVVRGLAAWQIRHQGPSVNQLAVDWEHHDRFIAPSYTNLGVGVSVLDRWRRCLRLVDGVQPQEAMARTVRRTIAAGVTFGFGSRLSGLGGPLSPSAACAVDHEAVSVATENRGFGTSRRPIQDESGRRYPDGAAVTRSPATYRRSCCRDLQSSLRRR